jgi:hypothetical protein
MSFASFSGLLRTEIPVYLEFPITRAIFCWAKSTEPIERIKRKIRALFIHGLLSKLAYNCQRIFTIPTLNKK